MGLFTRRGNRLASPALEDAEWEWRPEADGIIVAPGEQMEDDGCAGSRAFGVQFYREDAPGASLIIWAYAVHGGPSAGDSFVIGFRAEFVVDPATADDVWSASLYECDVAGSEWYGDLDGADGADEGAWQAAEALLRDGRNVAPFTAPDAIIAQGFGWDGSPW